MRSTKATLYRPDGPPQRTHWVLGHPRTSRSVRNSASCIQGHPIFRACWADHVPLAPNFTYRWAMTARSRRSRLHGGALVGVAVPEQSWISKLHCSETASQATPQRRRRRANATGGKDNATAQTLGRLGQGLQMVFSKPLTSQARCSNRPTSKSIRTARGKLRIRNSH